MPSQLAVITKVQGFGLVVDSSQRGKAGYNFTTVDINNQRIHKLPYNYEDHSFEWSSHFKIVATVRKRLEGVPLIETPDVSEIVYVEYCKKHPQEKVVFKHFLDAFKLGQGKGGFSKSDMQECWRQASRSNMYIDTYLNSLQDLMLPNSVEWDLAKRCSSHEYNHCAEFHSNHHTDYNSCNFCTLQPKIARTDPDGDIIIPIKINY